MHQAYLVAMQRVAGRQQFEISEMRGENQRADPRILRLQRLPDIRAAVGDSIFQAAKEKAAHADILCSCPAKVLVRGSQDSAALGLAPFRKRDLEIFKSNLHVPPVESIKQQRA